jgi:hypothetical protein
MLVNGPVFLYLLHNSCCSLPTIPHKAENKLRMVFKGG